MKKALILAIVLAVILGLALLANWQLGVALGVVYACVACVLIGWVGLPQPAAVTRLWAYLGLGDRTP